MPELDWSRFNGKPLLYWWQQRTAATQWCALSDQRHIGERFVSSCVSEAPSCNKALASVSSVECFNMSCVEWLVVYVCVVAYVRCVCVCSVSCVWSCEKYRAWKRKDTELGSEKLGAIKQEKFPRSSTKNQEHCERNDPD